MKKLFCVVLLAGLVLGLGMRAAAAELTLDENALISGMDCSWYQGYTPEIRSNAMTICLPLRGEDWAGDITVSLALEDPHVFLLSSQPLEVTVTPREGLYSVKLTLYLQRSRRNGDYPAVITIRGADNAGREKTQTMPYTIRIRDGYASHETLEPVIRDVQAQLDVGSSGSLRFTLTNPTSTIALSEGKLTVTEQTGAVLMAGASRLDIPELLPGQSIQVTVPMTVQADAPVRVHTLGLKLDYQALGKQASWEQQLALPVTQAIRLEQGGAELPSAIAGELGTLSLPLMNLGRGELRNVMAKLQVPGVVDGQSVLVGALPPGDTGLAKVTFTPPLDAAGIHPGTVTISCEDAYGNPFSRELEVCLTVEAPLPPAEELLPEEPEGPNLWTVVLILLCILLLAALIIQGVLLTGRLHRLEEERL